MAGNAKKLYLDAVLTPNQALSQTGFVLVMTVVGLLSFVAGMAFISIGAFPVLGFFGLDALLIWLAFRHNFRKLKQATHVRICAETVSLTHQQGGEDPIIAELPTAFTRVDLAHPERKPSELRVSFKDQTWVIGRFLTPKERRSFKRALEAAIHAARRERYAT